MEDNSGTTQTRVSKEEFKKMVEKTSPDSRLFVNCLKAFFVGGTICLIGEGITKYLLSSGFTKDESGMYTSIILIFLAALLTGLGWYEKLGKFAGAGSLIPITGFSNSIAAPAIEFKKEGYVFGVGAKMFLIAGPVIVYGTLASVIVGIIYYVLK